MVIPCVHYAIHDPKKCIYHTFANQTNACLTFSICNDIYNFSGAEWTTETIKARNGDNPSLQSDFSMLSRGDEISRIVDGDFEYRLEAGEPGQFGGVWRAPKGYK